VSKRIFLVAAEASGDALGADLARVLRERDHSLDIQGVGGPLMAERTLKASPSLASSMACSHIPV
jgi:lipid A disaccharide synthetase